MDEVTTFEYNYFKIITFVAEGALDNMARSCHLLYDSRCHVPWVGPVWTGAIILPIMNKVIAFKYHSFEIEIRGASESALNKCC